MSPPAIGIVAFGIGGILAAIIGETWPLLPAAAVCGLALMEVIWRDWP